MNVRFGRIAILVLAMIIVFGAVVAILLQIIPAPRKETDYLVIGTLATFASLATLFVVLITTIFKDPNALFFKRKKD
jgi:predicted membrane channel-forming protein YqfA (hemolysin III family)